MTLEDAEAVVAHFGKPPPLSPLIEWSPTMVALIDSLVAAGETPADAVEMALEVMVEPNRRAREERS